MPLRYSYLWKPDIYVVDEGKGFWNVLIDGIWRNACKNIGKRMKRLMIVFTSLSPLQIFLYVGKNAVESMTKMIVNIDNNANGLKWFVNGKWSDVKCFWRRDLQFKVSIPFDLWR